MGQYLPDWHPWENIKDFYVGRRETGACREMFCFETSWLTWVFGEIKTVQCMRGKLSNIDADIDDVYSILYKFQSGTVGTFLLDVVSRVPSRSLEIIGDEGTLLWDFDSVKAYDAKQKKWAEFKDEEKIAQKNYWAKDDMYIEEMRHFVAAIEGREKYTYSLKDDNAVFDLLVKAEQLSDKNLKL